MVWGDSSGITDILAEKQEKAMNGNTYSFWVFVMKLSGCDLFESTWIPLGEKRTSQSLKCWLNSTLTFNQVLDDMKPKSIKIPETSYNTI